MLLNIVSIMFAILYWPSPKAKRSFCRASPGGVPVLGLLNVLGQHATPVSYQSPSASLVINSPAHVRGGLVFTTEIVIIAVSC